MQIQEEEDVKLGNEIDLGDEEEVIKRRVDEWAKSEELLPFRRGCVYLTSYQTSNRWTIDCTGAFKIIMSYVL
jgi:hypothetical protein